MSSTPSSSKAHSSHSKSTTAKTKYLSKSSDSLSNQPTTETVDGNVSVTTSTNKTSHSKSMKKSQTALTGFDQQKASSSTQHSSSSNSQNNGGLRRRFSLFRTKRYQQQPAKPPSDQDLSLTVAVAASSDLNLHDKIHLLQDEVEQRNIIIENLRQELNVKTQELDSTKQRLFEINKSYDIEQALQIQTKMNTHLEEMLKENETLKKSIYDLECFAQQQQQSNTSNDGE
ncbi:unnamed protein product [Didymodactylos carnosus]|nr:unnamed protein product [Didymodactylos carnosus]CAF4184184.1 unnamed protein product [Didymodactylos carnosus]